MATHLTIVARRPQQPGQLSLQQRRQDQHKQVGDVPRPLYSIVKVRQEPRLVLPTDRVYTSFKRLFDIGWKHREKAAEINAIYLLGPGETQDFDSSSADYFFHGTRRACSIGERRMEPCYKPECSLCSILRESFKIDRAGNNGMFGPGIYTTPISSKADIYAKNHYVHSSQHAILICRVVCNRPQFLYRAEPNRRMPDPGFNSIRAVTRDKGGSVDYPEIVVYNEDAIVPYGLIMYTREGWTPR